MIKINVIAVGKIKEKFFADAVCEYEKRIRRFADFKITEIADAPPSKSASEQKSVESGRLLEKAKGFVIAMDGGGKELSSVQLASLIDEKCTEGVSEISFLIGGSYGHSDELLKRADAVLSFGKLTYPHQLFRVMLCEQIYRALTINAGTPYNK